MILPEIRNQIIWLYKAIFTLKLNPLTNLFHVTKNAQARFHGEFALIFIGIVWFDDKTGEKIQVEENRWKSRFCHIDGAQGEPSFTIGFHIQLISNTSKWMNCLCQNYMGISKINSTKLIYCLKQSISSTYLLHFDQLTHISWLLYKKTITNFYRQRWLEFI